jgi:hypothetical protein
LILASLAFRLALFLFSYFLFHLFGRLMALKIGGRTIDGPKRKTLVLPRDDGDIVFHFVAVNDDAEFEILCHHPKAPRLWRAGEGNISDTKDANYLKQVEIFTEQRANWYFLKSIETSNIEWTTVKLDDPTTWHLWRDEMKNAGFSVNEVNTIFQAFLDTNVVTDTMLKEARNRFLAEQAAKELSEKPTSLPTEQPLS